MKIVVLAGGISTERQVSLVSGTEICKALRSLGHRAVLVDLFLGLPDCGDPEKVFDSPDGLCSAFSIDRDAPSLEEVQRRRGGDPNCHIGPNVLALCAAADLVFLGLHGQDGEDGKIQAALSLMGIPFTGSSYLGSGMAMDKAVSKKIMEHCGVRTPAWQELTVREADIPQLAETLPMPCVVKTPAGGSSIGVFLPEDRAALADALRTLLAFSPRVVVEARIEGRELTVPVLGDEYLPAIEIVPPEGTYFDYIAKYQSGADGAREICPAQISESEFREMGEMALRLHRALGLSVYSRTDFILDREGTPWCLEINTLPGMTPASLFPKAAAVLGITYPQLCECIATLSLEVKR